jgi:hypothetical protein
MNGIYDWPLWVTVVVMLLLSRVATELGFRLGRAMRASKSEHMVVETIRAGTLGLVALLLGFSFAITSGRFNERSELVMDEASSIEACYLRADLVAEPASTQIRTALRRYMDFRLESYDVGLNRGEYQRSAGRMHGALDELWTAVVGAVNADRPRALASGIVPCANEVVHLSAKREWMRRFHMPAAVVVLLGLSIIICAAMIGHALGETGSRHVWLSLAVNLLIVMVAAIVLDFDRPRSGLIRVEQTPLIIVRDRMKSQAPR